VHVFFAKTLSAFTALVFIGVDIGMLVQVIFGRKTFLTLTA